jgi:hypothetical protein
MRAVAGTTSLSVVPGDLFFAETQEARGVVVQDVPFLLVGQKLGRCDAFDRETDA